MEFIHECLWYLGKFCGILRNSDTRFARILVVETAEAKQVGHFCWQCHLWFLLEVD